MATMSIFCLKKYFNNSLTVKFQNFIENYLTFRKMGLTVFSELQCKGSKQVKIRT